VVVKDMLMLALEPVLRDIRALGAPVPRIGDEDWAEDPQAASAMLLSDDGSAVGFRVRLGDPEADRIAEVADQVQDWVIDELMGTSATNWPPCPNHLQSHRLRVAVRDGVATWVCPSDATAFSAVGSLV